MPSQSASGYDFSAFTVQEHKPFDLDQLADRRRHRAGDWSIAEAYVAILMAAVMSDNSFNQDEVDTYHLLTRRSRALRALPAEDLRRAELALKPRMQTQENWFEEACRTLPADMCLPLFAHCADIVLSDGELLATEARFLEELAQLLDIPPDHARRVIEVLALKARY